jgi:hypothetical protein
VPLFSSFGEACTVTAMEIRIQDEALFVVPSSGALWSYDFGNNKRVIREGESPASDPPFQIAQARAADFNLLLVFPTLAPPSVAEQDKIRKLLTAHVGNRGVAFVMEQSRSYVSVIGSDANVAEHFAAAAAVVRTCWGWDESKSFTINVDELEFTVEPEFNGEVWTAWPEPVSRHGRARV